MYARLISFSGADPEKRDSAIEMIRGTVIPMLQSYDGFAGYISLYDADGHRAKAIILWSSRETLGHAVAAALVGVAPLGDGVLRPGQRRDAGLLDRPEDPDAAVVVEQVDPLDDLRVADHEPDPPAGHPVGLGHREHLDPDLLRARGGEEAARLAPVEDEVAVGEVVHDGGSGLVRVLDGLLEGAVGHRDRAGVARVVEVDRGDVLDRRSRKVRSPCARGSQRQETGPSPRERRRGGVIRVIRIRQNDGLSLF